MIPTIIDSIRFWKRLFLRQTRYSIREREKKYVEIVHFCWEKKNYQRSTDHRFRLVNHDDDQQPKVSVLMCYIHDDDDDAFIRYKRVLIKKIRKIKHWKEPNDTKKRKETKERENEKKEEEVKKNNDNKTQMNSFKSWKKEFLARKKLEFLFESIFLSAVRLVEWNVITQRERESKKATWIEMKSNIWI